MKISDLRPEKVKSYDYNLGLSDCEQIIKKAQAEGKIILNPLSEEELKIIINHESVILLEREAAKLAKAIIEAQRERGYEH